jgi:hypothetical protein
MGSVGAGQEVGEQVQVAVTGIVGIGVHEQGSAADLVGHREEAQQDVLEQAGTQAAALVSAVDAQPCEQRTGCG